MSGLVGGKIVVESHRIPSIGIGVLWGPDVSVISMGEVRRNGDS